MSNDQEPSDNEALCRAYFQSILDSTTGAVVLIAVDGTIKAFNQQAVADSLHYTAFPLEVGRLLVDYVVGDEKQSMQRHFEQAIQGQPVRELITIKGITAIEQWHEVSYTPIKDTAGHILGVCLHTQNVEYRQKMEQTLRNSEQQLQQAQKMSSIGRMASSVAHDFNNYLVGIMGYAQMLQDTLPPDSHNKHLADEIFRFSEKAGDLAQQLLKLSRKSLFHEQDMDLNELLRNLTLLLEHLVGSKIQLQMQLAANLPLFHADPNQIEQVILNLVINARDAMNQGGELRLSTFCQHLSQPLSLESFEPLKKGCYLCIQFQDTGLGIAPEHQNLIFEPLFTTKSEGQGTGLGLAVASNIVKHYQGAIQVSSEFGQGTTFTIWLPIQSGEVGFLF